MEWHLVCATCGDVVESFRRMYRLRSTYVCNRCAFENTATLDDYIQVSFTISICCPDKNFQSFDVLVV